MRFLIDNVLPPHLANLLQTAGHDAVHVRDYGMHAATDETILKRALDEDRIVVSADSDFSTLSALQEAAQPSFILFRNTNLLLSEDYAGVLIPALAILEPELRKGCVAVFRSGRLRVRRLPFADPCP